MSETQKTGQQPDVQTTRPVEAGEHASSAQGSKPETISDLIQELAKQAHQGNAVESIHEEIKEKKGIEDKTNRANAQKIMEDIRQVIRVARDPSKVSELRKLPVLVQQVLLSVKLNDVYEKSSPIYFAFLEASVNPAVNWDKSEDLAQLAQRIFEIRASDPEAARHVLKPLCDRLKEKGFNTAIDIVNFTNRVVTTSSQEEIQERKAMEKDYHDAYSTLTSFALGQPFHDRIRAETDAQFRAARSEGRMTQEEYNAILQQKLDQDAMNLRGEVLTAFNEIASAGNDSERFAKLTMYKQKLAMLQSAGMISEQTKRDLEQVPGKLETWFQKTDERMLMGHRFIDEVKRLGTIALSKRQEEVLKAMDNADSLEKLILESKDPQTGDRMYVSRASDGTEIVNWNTFYRDVKDICDEILSLADSHPNQFHQEAFNPMYEGHLYNILLKQFARLGTQMSQSTTSRLKDMKVEYFDITSVQNPYQSQDEGLPRDLLRLRQRKETKFASAMENLLVNRMTSLRQVREHFHNIQAICNLGLGWEQLSQYSDRLGIHAVDWYYHEDEELGMAYNFYMSSLEDEVSTNGRIMRTDFGHPDDQYALNPTERRAFAQMVSVMMQNPAYKGLERDAIEKKARQKIRSAAAVAQGVTGEFWNILMTARMPIGRTRGVDGNGDEVLLVTGSYVGTESAGYEKMITQLDLDLLLERFGLPKFFNQFRYVFRPRDLHHPPGPYSKDGMYLGHHGNIYEVRKMKENAFFKGMSDELADFDEKFVTMTDYLRTNCVGLFARGGWRFANWEAYLFPRDNQPKNPEAYKSIDYIKTLHTLRGVGSYVVKRFLDDLAGGGLTYVQVGNMTQQEVFYFTGGRLDKTGGAITPEEKKKYFSKDVLYKTLIFNQIARVSPSRFLRFESRQFTPSDELTLQTELTNRLKAVLADRNLHYSKEIVEDQVFKMYATALTLAEKSTWWQRRLNSTDYLFDIEDINESCRSQLLEFFNQYKRDVGESTRTGGQVIKILENEEDFLFVLKDVYQTLRASVGNPGNFDPSLPKGADRGLRAGKRRYRYNDISRGEETLQERFARFLATTDGSAKGDIIHRLAGSDFDMSEFYFSAGGDRGTGRSMGETFKVASEMNPTVSEIFNVAIPELVKGHYKDIHEFEKAVQQLFADRIKKIHGAIANMDKAQADKYVVSLGVFIAQLMGEDRIYRIRGLGDAVENFVRRMDPTTAASAMQDFFGTSLAHPTLALNSDQLYAFGEIFLRACNVPLDKPIAETYVPVKFLGKELWKKRVNQGEEWEKTKVLGFIPWRKKVYTKGHDATIHDFEKAIGLTTGAKWLETYGPAAVIAIVAILLLMLKMAMDKNKKK